MIIRHRPSGLKLFLRLRGAVMPNGLPRDALCRASEIGLRTALNDKHVPPPPAAVNFCLP
jgi:hypothetical protein